MVGVNIEKFPLSVYLIQFKFKSGSFSSIMLNSCLSDVTMLAEFNFAIAKTKESPKDIL